MSSSKNTALMFLLGALLVGGALGFSVDRMLLHDRLGGGETQRSMRERIAGQLDLSATQRATFDSILAARDAELNTVMAPVRAKMDSVRPRYAAVRDSARARIRTILDADQQRRFDAIIAELRADEDARRRRDADKRAAN